MLSKDVFKTLIAAVPALIELNEPVFICDCPIEPLLMDPTKRVPIVNVLVNPKAVLKLLTDNVSIPAFPLLRELKLALWAVIELTSRLSVARCPESNKAPLSYPDSAVMGIVAEAYTLAGKEPTMRAAGILVKPIAEPVKLVAVAVPITRELPVKVVAPVIFVGPTIRTPPASTTSRATVGELIPIPIRLFNVSIVIVARLPSNVDILQRVSYPTIVLFPIKRRLPSTGSGVKIIFSVVALGDKLAKAKRSLVKNNIVDILVCPLWKNNIFPRKEMTN